MVKRVSVVGRGVTRAEFVEFLAPLTASEKEELRSGVLNRDYSALGRLQPIVTKAKRYVRPGDRPQARRDAGGHVELSETGSRRPRKPRYGSNRWFAWQVLEFHWQLERAIERDDAAAAALAMYHLMSAAVVWEAKSAFQEPVLSDQRTQAQRKAARDESRTTRATARAKREREWLADAQKLRRNHPDWKNWTIAVHIHKKHQNNPNFLKGIRTIYQAIK